VEFELRPSRRGIAPLRAILKEIFDIEIIGVKTADVLEFLKSARPKAACVVIPDFPQFESEFVNSTQRSPVAD